MQDKSYAIALVIILGICALGMYVAISGFFNSAPPAAANTPGVPATQVVIAVPTETAAVAATIPLIPSVTPLPAPIGATQTITASTTTGPTPLPTLAPRPVTPATATKQATQSCGFQFCAKAGPPDDAMGPAGNPCPLNYVWGRIVDMSGQGVPNLRIRVKLPTGEISEDKRSKDKPDIPGKYDIPAQNGNYIIWLIDDSGAQASPQITVSVAVTPQGFSGAGNCPTRLDFVAQK